MKKYTSVFVPLLLAAVGILALLMLPSSYAAPSHPEHSAVPGHPEPRLQVRQVEVAGPIAGYLALVWEVPADLPSDAQLQIEALDSSGSAYFSASCPAGAGNYLLQDPAFAEAQYFRLTLVGSHSQPLGWPLVIPTSVPANLEVSQVGLLGSLSGLTAIEWTAPEAMPKDAWLRIESLDSQGRVAFSAFCPAGDESYLLPDAALPLRLNEQFRLTLLGSRSQPLGAPVLFTVSELLYQ